jgi:signal transduction histidine kinase
LGIKAYVFFMTGEKEEFEATAQQYQQVKDEYNYMVANKQAGYQLLDTRYDNVVEVAQKAFKGDFKGAHELAQTSQLNVEEKLVIFQLHSLEGSYAKDQSIKILTMWLIGLTSLYFFVYLMGRRRLIKKIWKRNAELRVALEKADAANQMKASFIRSMSHEIRTPLNAINGFTNILCTDDGLLSEDEKSDIKERITSSSETITIIINELLELAAGESVTIDLNELSPVNINSVCRQVTALTEERNENGLEISFTSELDDYFTIRSNEDTVLQIMKKILSNALKFTEEGSIKVHVAQHDQRIDISVTDTGTGIPEDKQGIIFDNFVKLDEFKNGVGLGLSISRRLARLLGGDIVIDNTYKKGSRFILQLPVIN